MTYKLLILLTFVAFSCKSKSEMALQLSSKLEDTSAAISPSDIKVEFKNTPETHSSDTSLDVSVSGENVVQYKYWIGEATDDSLTCAGAVYSNWVDVKENIELSNLGDDGYKIICALGKNYDGIEQLSDSYYKWQKDTTLPIANAGPDQSVNVGDTVTLDGSKSTDSSGHALSYKWSQISREIITISDTTLSKPTFTAPNVTSDSEIILQLIVNDGLQDSIADTIKITVKALVTGFSKTGDITLSISGKAMTYYDGYLYIGRCDNKIEKIKVSDMSSEGVLDSTVSVSKCFYVADNDGTYAYFVTDSSPSSIARIKLSDFTLVDTLVLDAGDKEVMSGGIVGTNLFLATNTWWTDKAKIIKVDLNTFTRDSGLDLNAGEAPIRAMAIDAANNLAYAAILGDSGTSKPASIVKIDLNTLTRVGALALNDGEWEIENNGFVAHGFAYFGLKSNPAKIIKIQLSDFTRYDAIILDSGDKEIVSAVVDTNTDYAYFGLNTTPGGVVKIDLQLFKKVDETIFSSATPANAERYWGAAIDQANHQLFFSTWPSAFPFSTPEDCKVIKYGE